MANPVSASFDRWWNGISLRAKVTGVTVFLLTLGLIVAGAGTMTVLRAYMVERLDGVILTQGQETHAGLGLDAVRNYPPSSMPQRYPPRGSCSRRTWSPMLPRAGPCSTR